MAENKTQTAELLRASADSDGRTPFDAERTPVQTLHVIRRHYQRFQT